ncbi:MAG: serine--tRNA ligase [Candidatus Micrarchaeota archaeon]|nr:serine--tRNA ligase [Candidatus Micrarchaeota archaeon]
MINTKYVREHLAEIRETLKNRGSSFPLDELLSADEKWRKLKTEYQALQFKRNKASLEVSAAKKKGQDIKEMVSALAQLKDQMEGLESEIPKYEEKIDSLVWNIPNVLDKAVPIGTPPEANKILKIKGDPKRKSGPNHEEILTKLGLLDVERAAKTAGSRFYYLRGDLVLLEQSLLRYALDKLSKKGYTPVLPPFMLRKKYYRGVAPLGVFEDALYRISEAKEVSGMKDAEHLDDELFLISTAEHPLASMHAEELFSGADLPLKYAGISPSFRREAGSHGKDTKGIFRVHQFDKVEQFIYCRQEDEKKYFDELLANSEEILQELDIPYRLVLLCSGDTGHQMSKTIDFECWFPGQGDYRELGSCSSAGTWQSMRLDIKYDDKNERRYASTLNNTAISAQRTLACLVENYVSKDGSIEVPEVLVPYMGKSRITG